MSKIGLLVGAEDLTVFLMSTERSPFYLEGVMPVGIYKRVVSEKMRQANSRRRLGKKHSEESKRKIGLANTGKTLSKEARAKLSKAHMGKFVSEETRRKQSKVRYKYGSHTYLSDVANRVYKEHNTNYICEICSRPDRIHIHHKDKNRRNNHISNLQALCSRCHLRLHKLGRKGRSTQIEKRKPVWQLDLNGKRIKRFDGACIAIKELGLSHTAIHNCCKGYTKTAGGYKWEKA